MKKNIISTLTLTIACLIGTAFTGCAANAQNSANIQKAGSPAETESETENKELKGSLSLAGSTSMEKLCEAMSESFMEDNPGVTVTVEYTGSGAGLESLAAGSVDIGNASRGIKDEEKEKGLSENIVAIDGIAVITDKNNSINDISSEDLKKIYTGEVSDWSELGNESQPVVVIGREAGSGTRDAFEELLELKDQCKYAQELDSTGAVLAKVASTPGAIGYVSLDVVDDTVTGLKIDGIDPVEEQILAGKYLLQRPFVMATKGEIGAQNETVQAWFDYINSEKGKEVIKAVGLIIAQ